MSSSWDLDQDSVRVIGILIKAPLTQQAYLQEASPSLARCQHSTLQCVVRASANEGQLTSVDIFIDKLWHCALGRLSSRLSLELTADVSCATLVKGSL